MIFLTLFLVNLKFEWIVEDLFFVTYIFVFFGVLEEPLLNLFAAEGVTCTPLSLLASGEKNSCLPLDEEPTTDGDWLCLLGLGEIMYPLKDESFRFLIYDVLLYRGITCNPLPGETRFLSSFWAIGEIIPILDEMLAWEPKGDLLDLGLGESSGHLGAKLIYLSSPS